MYLSGLGRMMGVVVFGDDDIEVVLLSGLRPIGFVIAVLRLLLHV